MIELRKANPSDRIIELGGGANPHPACDLNVDVRQCYDANGKPTVHFTADFDEPLPIQSDEWDGVYSCFVIEHLSWRKVRQFVEEIYRILKPGGRAVLITANTEAQMQWVLEKEEWDDDCSCILFGDQNYPENAHKNAFKPSYAIKLFTDVGFRDVTITPFGDLQTDMVIQALKPVDAPKQEGTLTVASKPQPPELSPPQTLLPRPPADLAPSEVFDMAYFDGGRKWGGYAPPGYADFPCHEVTARKILKLKPESVLELGAARGYVGKRLEDAGVPYVGLEVSHHCYQTRVSANVKKADLMEEWMVESGFYDLCFSESVLEHIPEEKLPHVFEQMQKYTKRGLHGIDFGVGDDGFDRTHCTLRPKEWWQERMPEGHEVVDSNHLEHGPLPEDYVNGDGKVKLNVGCFLTQFHNGWINIDVHDLRSFAESQRYNFLCHDVRDGLPYQTGEVDMIYASHFIEHLTYAEGMSFLRECRRVLKSGGYLRLIAPDLHKLAMNALAGDGDVSGVNDRYDHGKLKDEKLWALLLDGHSSVHDPYCLVERLREVGFRARVAAHRKSECPQMLRETLDLLPCLSFYVDAWVE